MRQNYASDLPPSRRSLTPKNSWRLVRVFFFFVPAASKEAVETFELVPRSSACVSLSFYHVEAMCPLSVIDSTSHAQPGPEGLYIKETQEGGRQGAHPADVEETGRETHGA